MPNVSAGPKVGPIHHAVLAMAGLAAAGWSRCTKKKVNLPCV